MENKQDVEKLHTGLAAEFLLISPFDSLVSLWLLRIN